VRLTRLHASLSVQKKTRSRHNISFVKMCVPAGLYVCLHSHHQHSPHRSLYRPASTCKSGAFVRVSQCADAHTFGTAGGFVPPEVPKPLTRRWCLSPPVASFLRALRCHVLCADFCVPCGRRVSDLMQFRHVLFYAGESFLSGQVTSVALQPDVADLREHGCCCRAPNFKAKRSLTSVCVHINACTLFDAARNCITDMLVCVVVVLLLHQHCSLWRIHNHHTQIMWRVYACTMC
jgi:hypothetical protein